MRVGERAQVLALSRETDEDRSAHHGKEGLLVRRLNVAWTPTEGALWELRFDDGVTVVFAESELGLVGPDGTVPVDMTPLREGWGQAPREPSTPFRRLGGGSQAALAVLALVVFALAGVLLVWAGVAESDTRYSVAGGVLVLLGIGTAGVLIR